MVDFTGTTLGNAERLPLFLLQTVLFPEQRLALRVFEARYMDMVAACLKSQSPFGVCLIRSGQEVGEIAEPAAIGTLAHIEHWDMPQSGVLHILVRGDLRFEIERTCPAGKLAQADVRLWEDEVKQPLPAQFSSLVGLLRRVMPDYDGEGIAEPHRFEDASWVGMRLAQLLPVENTYKQAWLEERQPLRRLAAINSLMTDMAGTHD
ncbi:MAG: LON peptidase substrate-binding domain-containing protein [Acidiferrobacterales bacterium]